MDGTQPHRFPPDDRTTVQHPWVDDPHPQKIHSWHGDGFRIEVHPRDHTGDGSAIQLSYRVFDDIWAGLSGQEPLIFAGDDLLSDPHTGAAHRPAQALSAIFGCESGEFAETYFAAYSPAQLAWRDARAGDLSTWGRNLSTGN